MKRQTVKALTWWWSVLAEPAVRLETCEEERKGTGGAQRKELMINCLDLRDL
jgi:hypothetical protein